VQSAKGTIVQEKNDKYQMTNAKSIAKIPMIKRGKRKKYNIINLRVFVPLWQV
jgi:hypothetical protein